jgi:rhomboid protease GluP
MEVAGEAGHTEELSMHPLEPVQYLAAVQKAVARLGWLPVFVTGNSIACHTPTNDYFAGAVITITIQGKKATLHSMPGNEHTWDEVESRTNAEIYKTTIAQVIEEQEKANRNLHPMHREKYGALVPSKNYLVTPVIVYANVLVFIAMVLAGVSPLQPTAERLFSWGGNLRLAVEQGERWRLVTYMFLHGGVMHLLMNTFALLYIGMFLEPLLGRFRFASAYVLTGVCAGIVSIMVHTSSVGVGASGAIFGMFGVFLSMLSTSYIQKTMRKTMLRSILFFVVLNLLYGMQGNTDNAAHIGGLLSGLIIGYVYYRGIAKHSFKRQLLTTAILASLIILLGMFVLTRI